MSRHACEQAHVLPGKHVSRHTYTVLLLPLTEGVL